MKKIIIFFIVFSFLFSSYNTNATNYCESEKQNYLNILQQYNNIVDRINNLYDEIVERLKGTGATKNDLYSLYLKEKQELLKEGVVIENNLNDKKVIYNSCISNLENNLTNLFNNGYNAYNKGQYLDAINYYKQYLELLGDITDKNYKIAQGNLVLALNAQGDTYYNKNDYNNALKYYIEGLGYDNKNDKSLLNTGIMYYNLKDFNNAKKYLNECYNITSNSSYIKLINGVLEDIKNQEENQELLKNAPTNDLLSGYQYYLKQLNIPNAWSKVKNNNQVVVAIIDDGININHPDLTDNIWVNTNAKYGDSKIIDFVGDGMPANLPVGEHGTMVAGIIGATKNNNEGIAGIANNVKLMPLRVFDSKGGATEDSIIEAINYAIDNGANIINLSLGQSQFYYSNKYDEVIQKAYKNGVVVIIASGNGDLLSKQDTGINLTNNPISPVCNNEGKFKYSIGVYAIDEKGYRTNWTNYGDCANFGAPGVGIVSTSIPIYNSNYGSNYNNLDGTSFSATIISGIIALGYNQYGYVNPNDVYNALNESYISYKLPDGQTGYKIDASKYIDNLLYIKMKNEKDEKLKQKAEITFNQIKKKLSKLSEMKRKITYNSILKQLNGFKGKIKSDKEIILNELIRLIQSEI